MKRVILFIVIMFILSLFGCGNPSPNPAEDLTETVNVLSEAEKCNQITEINRKTLCLAIAFEDIRLCETITGSFKEECVLVLAEMVYNKSLVNYCDMAKADDNKKICRALILEDINVCFSSWEIGGDLGASLPMRDCIDLTSRKSKDPSNCDVFVTRSSEIYAVCGDTSDCKGQWIDGAQYNADDCKSAVEEAIRNG